MIYFTLIAPQLPENIGMVARAMANMGLSKLRLVAPREGWPHEKAFPPASGADDILNAAQVFDTLNEAVADCHFVIATTARRHAQAKPVLGPQEAARQVHARLKAGQKAAVVFGRERNGLEADEISRCHAVLTLPVNPEFSSLNLSQAVLLVGYALMMESAEEGELIPYVTNLGSPPAATADMEQLMTHLTQALDKKSYFQPAHRKNTMQRNLRNIFMRQHLTRQDVQTLHGVFAALSSDDEISYPV